MATISAAAAATAGFLAAAATAASAVRRGVRLGLGHLDVGRFRCPREVRLDVSLARGPSGADMLFGEGRVGRLRRPSDMRLIVDLAGRMSGADVRFGQGGRPVIGAAPLQVVLGSDVGAARGHGEAARSLLLGRQAPGMGGDRRRPAGVH
ncbi:MAG TPA: hypothetical protein VIJ94_03065, partial [Caulobacteraceae bacterium]